MARFSKNITKQLKSKKQDNCITLEFKKCLEKFTDEHCDVLKKLAKR